MNITRYFVISQISFCSLPPIQETQFFYSNSDDPRKDFENHVQLGEGFKLISFELAQPTKSPLATLPY